MAIFKRLLLAIVCVAVVQIFVTVRYFILNTDQLTGTSDRVKRTYSNHIQVSTDISTLNGGKPVRHFAFLKVHKTGSGTATTIFFRYGVSRGLTFVLPKFWNIVSTTDTLRDRDLYPKLNEPFDIETSHVIYNRKAFEEYLHKDTVYIGIVREPYLQFKSSLNYFMPKHVFDIKGANPVQTYLTNPLKYEVFKSPRYSWINNRQAAEFGTPDEIVIDRNQTAMDEYVEKLGQEFDFVIVSEYFDESFVLLKRMLNWDLKDILYTKLHARGGDLPKTMPKSNDRNLYRQYAFADYSIYNYFHRRLWYQMFQAGDDFFDEVLYFKRIRNEVNDFCQTYPNVSGVYKVEENLWSKGFAVDLEFCEQLCAQEEYWIAKIALTQYNVKLNVTNACWKP